MSKKSKIIIGGLIIFLIAAAGVVKFSFSSGYKIYIANNTNKTVEDLELKYKDGSNIQTISQIEPKKHWKDNIDTNNIKGENAIILTYKDTKGNSYEKSVVGYLEKGYSGQSNVVISKIDNNGKLEIEIK